MPSKESPVVTAAKKFANKSGPDGTVIKAFIAGARWHTKEQNKLKIARLMNDLKNDAT